MLFQEFYKEFPEIKVTSISGSGVANAYRILAERRAGKYLADLFSGSPNSAYERLHKAGVLDPIKNQLLLPEVIDQSKWFGGKHRYIDPGRMYNFVYLGSASSLVIAYNSKVVDPAAFKSYRDLYESEMEGQDCFYRSKA